jgi:hypothetical protein
MPSVVGRKVTRDKNMTERREKKRKMVNYLEKKINIKKSTSKPSRPAHPADNLLAPVSRKHVNTTMHM